MIHKFKVLVILVIIFLCFIVGDNVQAGNKKVPTLMHMGIDDNTMTVENTKVKMELFLKDS